MSSRFKPLGLTIVVPTIKAEGIPCKYCINSCIPLTLDFGEFGARCGMQVGMKWESSTGQLKDLMGVFSNELISKPVKIEGCFENLVTGFHVSKQVETDRGQSSDTHSFPPDWAFQGPGEIVLDQLFVYGMPFKAAPNSGFRITHKVKEIAKGRFLVTTMKIGATVRVRGYINSNSGQVELGTEYFSESGAGEARVIQVLEKGGKGPIKADMRMLREGTFS